MRWDILSHHLTYRWGDPRCASARLRRHRRGDGYHCVELHYSITVSTRERMLLWSISWLFFCDKVCLRSLDMFSFDRKIICFVIEFDRFAFFWVRLNSACLINRTIVWAHSFQSTALGTIEWLTMCSLPFISLYELDLTACYEWNLSKAIFVLNQPMERPIEYYDKLIRESITYHVCDRRYLPRSSAV